MKKRHDSKIFRINVPKKTFFCFLPAWIILLSTWVHQTERQQFFISDWKRQIPYFAQIKINNEGNFSTLSSCLIENFVTLWLLISLLGVTLPYFVNSNPLKQSFSIYNPFPDIWRTFSLSLYPNQILHSACLNFPVCRIILCIDIEIMENPLRFSGVEKMFRFIETALFGGYRQYSKKINYYLKLYFSHILLHIIYL